MMRISPGEAKAWQGRFIDVRNFDEFASERIDGPICVPLGRLMAEASAWDPEEAILLLCKSGARASQGAQQLEAVGFRDVRVVEGGINACRAAGLSIHQDRTTLPLQRQVFIAAGIVLLAGLGLSLIHPWFLALDWFAASMLVIAGVTGFCPMAIMLKVMPWNKPSPSSGASCAAGSCCTGARTA
jgi:rhodanese-related sulfurtransferase